MLTWVAAGHVGRLRRRQLSSIGAVLFHCNGPLLRLLSLPGSLARCCRALLTLCLARAAATCSALLVPSVSLKGVLLALRRLWLRVQLLRYAGELR